MKLRTALGGLLVALMVGCASLPDFMAPISTLSGLNLIPQSSVDKLTYTNDDEFDRLLYASLKAVPPATAGVPRVTVNVKSPVRTSALASVSNLPAAVQLIKAERIARWLAMVQMRGGTTITCQMSKKEGGLIPVILDVITFVGKVQHALMYEAASNYNAIIYTSADDATLIDHVVFQAKSLGGLSCTS